MSPEWMLTLGALACTGAIVAHMSVEPASAGARGWQWDSSHRCRLALLGVDMTDRGTRVRIRNDSVFAVSYRLVMDPARPLIIEAWPQAVTEIVLEGSGHGVEIHVPDCRRRI